MSENIRDVNKQSRVTYQNLPGQNHFQTCYLAFCEALLLIRSGAYLEPDNPLKPNLKPKIAVVALKKLFENPLLASELKSDMVKVLFSHTSQDSQNDEYNVDSGHSEQVV